VLILKNKKIILIYFKIKNILKKNFYSQSFKERDNVCRNAINLCIKLFVTCVVGLSSSDFKFKLALKLVLSPPYIEFHVKV
jgi:hypothetical protein